jgi:RimJ/RimL family protein N-acetyltransferase
VSAAPDLCIQGTCDPRNVAAARVLQRLGMQYEGRLRDAMLIRDGRRGSDLYGGMAEEAMPGD